MAAVALSAQGALRQWEPSDYVQDGLVLHYDGIRNQGLGTPHDNAAASWVDLSPSGNDASTYSHSSASDNGAWTANGFVFATDSYWIVDNRTTLPGDFTLQAVCNTTTTSMQNTKSWPNLVGNNGAGASGNTDELAIFYHKGNKRLSTKFLNAYLDQYLTSWNCRYATVMRSGAQASLFDGTTPNLISTSKTGAIGVDFLIGSGTTDKNDGGSGDRRFTGTIHSVRVYSAALSNDELAWNRALDEARFFGASSVPESAICAAAVPDAVIASSVTGASGTEAVGCYVVDDEGYTFRAASFASVSGVSYACTGCTVATWDDTLGAYGAAETRDGVFAVAVAPGDKVKITWQWSAASGSLDAGYVTEDLALRLDGIDNAGFGVHDSSATTWKDLSGNDRDAVLYGNADGTSYWTDDGFYFNFNAVFATTATFAFGTQYTFEVLLDAKRSDWWNDTTEKDILVSSAGIDGGAIYYKAANAILCHRSNTTTGSAWNAMPGFYQLATVKYLAALRNESKTALITGTTYPTTEYDVSNGAPANYVTNAWLVGSKNTAIDPTTWLVGGRTTAPANTTKGTVKSVRLYNRLLTEAELAQNRAVDEARFFGSTPASNAVVVASAIAGLEGRETSGTYFPDGWTFAAGAGTNTVRGIGWQCAGYQIQTWDSENSCWGAQTSYASSTYASPASPFASVRLTWLWKPVSGIRTAADYALADYATGAVALHLDGIRNVGADAAHDSSATVWSDLSGNGRDATLAGNSSGASAWNAAGDGFFFASNAVFATSATFALGKSATIQILADAKRDDQRAGAHNSVFAMPASSWNDGGIYYKYDGNNNAYYRTDNLNGSAWNNNAGIYNAASWSYLTALRDDAKTALVAGTDYPTTTSAAGVEASHYVTTGWLNGTKSDVASASGWRIGSSSSAGGGDPLYGTIKSVRLYDRLLAEDELAWNRSVDSARYFGELTVTNVVVDGKYANYEGRAAGAYEVFGSATFTAGAATDAKGKVRPVVGYTVEAWNPKTGIWGTAAYHAGSSYAYTVGTDPAKVRLTWKWQPDGTAVIFR